MSAYRGRVRIWLFPIVLWIVAGSNLWIGADGNRQRGHIASVEAIGIVVSDMQRSVDFYTRVLKFDKISDFEVWGNEYERLEGVFGLRMRRVRLRLGDEFINLTEYMVPKGKPLPVDSQSNDRWFQHIAIIVSDMNRAYQWLRSNSVRYASTEPQRLPDWNPAAGGIEAFYFKDPDNHVLEILHFPEGKGLPKWHMPADRLFLGIDHTAIVVGNTDASLKFYHDLLGLQIVGRSENYGTEQEHLNNVFGAKLRITTLRAPSGPGVELLEYLIPRDGRPFPADSRSNDLLGWKTEMSSPDAAAVVESLMSAEVAFVSPGLMSLPDKSLGSPKACVVRDPDGHAIQLTLKQKEEDQRANR